MATKREDIVDAAAQLIKQQGVHAASISGIIAASHASAGSIYHHFANKNEIVLEVARTRLAEPLRAAVLAPVEGPLAPAQRGRPTRVASLFTRGHTTTTGDHPGSRPG